MAGDHDYPVSAYSAIKKEGIPMYKRARAAAEKGDVVTEVPVRKMSLYDSVLEKIELGDHFAIATIKFSVASGTYIRSLAEALGEKLIILRRFRIYAEPKWGSMK